MKCCGNCAVCELQVDKQACCAIQTLKNLVEVKAVLVEVRSMLSAKDVDAFALIPDIDFGPTAPGTEIQ